MPPCGIPLPGAADDVAGLTAQQIMDKFSLPEKPLYICDVELPAGTADDDVAEAGL